VVSGVKKEPSHSVETSEQGKPDHPPETAGEPQGTLLGERVKEAGESKSGAVMARI
jgi:hypothetical protein